MSRHFNLQPRRWPWAIAIAFAVAFAGTLVVVMLQGEKPFYNDAGTYWTAGSTFTVEGHFSLLNFSQLTIGYVLPLINQELQQLATALAWTASSTVKLVNALIIALIGTVLGPALVRTVWPQQPSWGILRRLTLTALLVVFWSGFLNFPLSDFPALAMALLTLIAVARTDGLAWMLVAGAALALTINMRPEYVLLVPAVVALVAWSWFDQRRAEHASGAKRALCATLLLVGFAAVSLPQSLADQRHHEGASFIPHSSILEPSVYFAEGMSVQAYDAFLLNGEPRVEMRYGYPAGQRLVEEQKEGKVSSTSQYLGLFVSHPLVMGGMIVRHIVNGLDPLYSAYIVENLSHKGRIWGRIAGFLLLFVALLRVLWPAARRLLGPGRLRYLAALALCCVPALPSEMERRYMLPVYMLGYMLALTPRWPNPFATAGAGLRRLRTPAVIAVVFIAYASFVWYITNGAIDNLVFRDGVTHQILIAR
jgi:MFS family permease